MRRETEKKGRGELEQSFHECGKEVKRVEDEEREVASRKRKRECHGTDIGELL